MAPLCAAPFKCSLLGSRLLTAALLALAGASACDKDDQQKAVEEQRQATEKAQEAQLEANEKISEARREGEKAANEAARERSETRVRLQKDVDAVDRKISHLKELGVKATGAAKKNADVAEAEAETRRTKLQADLRKLETETGAAWDSAKDEVERNIAAVSASVNSWESTLSNKPAR